MSATSSFLRKGSGQKYIKNRPYTANCPKRVRKLRSQITSIHPNLITLSDCAAFLNSVATEAHTDTRAQISEEMWDFVHFQCTRC